MSEEIKAEAPAVANPRKSKIVKTISRKINTAKYETLQVNVSYEEEIEWSNIAERAKKSEAITTLLLKDYGKTLLTVQKGLGLIENNTISENAIEESRKTSLKDQGLDGL